MEGKESDCLFTTSRRRIEGWGWNERKVVANLQPPAEDWRVHGDGRKGKWLLIFTTSRGKFVGRGWKKSKRQCLLSLDCVYAVHVGAQTGFSSLLVDID